MNTKKVRPILLPSKNTNSQLEIDDLSVGKLSYESKLYQCKRPQQLILISLEDEKIEVGDKWIYICPIHGIDYGDNGEAVVTNNIPNGIKWFNKLHDKKNYHKVIATQDQLSPELIQQLIVEYNNGDMKDFEIEMVIMNKGYNKPEDYPYQEIDIPKLTNGYITVVNKQPISYSEEEVRELLKKVLEEEPEEPDQIPAKYFWEWFNIWFETNKKK